MKIPQLAGVIVTSMVIILVVVSVLIPIIQESDTTTYVESENTGQDYLMSKGDATYSVTVTVTSVGDSSATYSIGSESKTITGEDTVVWIWDNGIATLRATGAIVATKNVAANAMSLTTANDYFEFNGAGTFTVKKNVGEDNESSRTSPYTWAMHPDASGEWGAFTMDFNASKASSFYVVSTNTNFLSSSVGYGTVGNMTLLVGHSTEAATFDVTYTDKGVYNTVSGCTVSQTVNSSSVTVAPFVFIAPMDYTSGTSDGGIVNTLLGIVPVLIIVGIVMAVVGVYFKGRDY